MTDINDFLKRPLIKVSEGTCMKEIYELMKEKKIRHVPVVQGKKLVGIISDRDVLKHSTFDSGDGANPSDLKASDIMTSNVISAQKYHALEDIAATLVYHKIDCIPICQSNGELLGLVTTSDIIKFFCSEQLAKGKIANPIAADRKR